MYKSRYTLLIPLDNNNAILYNTLSGAVDRINSSIQSAWKSDDLTSLPSKFKSLLVKRGHAFLLESNEKQVFAQLTDTLESIERNASTNFVVIPSYSCNLACVYCYEGGLTNSASLMSVEQTKHLRSAINSLINIRSGDSSLTLMGGEPLLGRNMTIIRILLGLAVEYGMVADAVTNGTTLSTYATKLKKWGLSSVQITLDGPSIVHNERRPHRNGRPTFNKVINGIEAALNEGIKVELRVNIDSRNIDMLHELALDLTKKGWLDSNSFHAYLYPLSESGCFGQQEFLLEETELARQVIQKYREDPIISIFDWRFHGLDHIAAILNKKQPLMPMLRFCSATKGQYVFDPTGNIYACWWGFGNPDFVIGQYSPDLKLDNNKLNDWHNRSVLSIDKCRECKNALICGAGCAYKAYHQYGTINAPRCNAFAELINNIVPCFLSHENFSSNPNNSTTSFIS